jgi:hypothetical protein
MSSGLQDTILTASAVTAAVAVVGLTVAQTDAVSRRILSPEMLQAKRMQEYAYRWQQCNDKAQLRVHYAVKGGVSALEAEQLQSQKVKPPSTSQIWDDTGVKELIEEWIATDKQNHHQERKAATSGTGVSAAVRDSSLSPFPRILGVSQEEESRDLVLEVYHPLSGVYTLPFLTFGVALADALEATITTTALCFVADASSGLGTRMLANLMEASKAGVVSLYLLKHWMWAAHMPRFSSMCFRPFLNSRLLSKNPFG